MSHSIVIRSIITEKSIDRTKDQLYTFEVDRTATKNQIKKHIETLFNVNVLSVKKHRRVGKTKRVGRKRVMKKTKGYTFAIVKLKKDQRIDLFTISPEENK